MCKYCKTDRNKEMTRNKAILRGKTGGGDMVLNVWVDLLGVDDEKGPPISLFVSGNVNRNADIFTLTVPVKYCPMCGRKFNAGE